MILEQLISMSVLKLGVINENQIFIKERVLSADDKNIALKNGKLQINEESFLEFFDKNGIIDHHIPESYVDN